MRQVCIIISEFLGGHGLGGDTGWHLGRRRGYDRRQCRYVFGIAVPGTCPKPHFEDWPMWDAIAHQQMWQGWPQQAWQGGLRIMVVSVAESNFLCNNTAFETRRYGCDEMESVRLRCELDPERRGLHLRSRGRHLPQRGPPVGAGTSGRAGVPSTPRRARATRASSPHPTPSCPGAG